MRPERPRVPRFRDLCLLIYEAAAAHRRSVRQASSGPTHLGPTMHASNAQANEPHQLGYLNPPGWGTPNAGAEEATANGPTDPTGFDSPYRTTPHLQPPVSRNRWTGPARRTNAQVGSTPGRPPRRYAEIFLGIVTCILGNIALALAVAVMSTMDGGSRLGPLVFIGSNIAAMVVPTRKGHGWFAVGWALGYAVGVMLLILGIITVFIVAD